MSDYEPTPEQVEAAARAMWDRYGDRGMFDHAPEHMRAAFRADATATLTAAGPLIAAGALREAAGVFVNADVFTTEEQREFAAWLMVRAARIARGEGS